MRKALLAGISNAGALQSWPEKAWALRDAFDGILAVIGKKVAP